MQALDYERPLYVEHRRPGGRGIWLVLCTFWTTCGAMLLFLPIRGSFFVRMMGVTPLVIGIVAPLFFYGLQQRTRVFADHLESTITVWGRRFWQKTWHWQRIEQCCAVRENRIIGTLVDIQSQLSIPTRGKVLSVSPACTMVMFCGDGVSARLNDGHNIVIGTDQPQTLLHAIETAQKTATPGYSNN
ncbi:MAG TPA: hypothetical protein VGG19_09185 [Tepidisphaeraceae bacterium]